MIKLVINSTFNKRYFSNTVRGNIKSIYQWNDYLEHCTRNVYQFEFEKQMKIKQFYDNLGEMITQLPTYSLRLICEKETTKTLLKIISCNKNLVLYSYDSMVVASVMFNFTQDKDKLFLINYSLSTDSKVIKFFKYGNLILKRENLLRHLYIDITSFDETCLPRVEETDGSLPLLIYSRYVYLKSTGTSTNDYIRLLERYFDGIETNVTGRIKVLEATIGQIHLKKELPIVKLVSDVNLSHFRQYSESYSFYETVSILTIIASENFLINYDISLFYDLIVERILFTFDINYCDLTILNEILFSLERLGVYRKGEELYSKIIEIMRRDFLVFYNSSNLGLLVGDTDSYEITQISDSDIHDFIVSNRLRQSDVSLIASFVDRYTKEENLIKKFLIYINIKLWVRNNKEANLEDLIQNNHELLYFYKSLKGN
jgi:hypothetical protein